MTDASPCIDDALVRRLVSTQFPRWASLPVKAVEPGGWDNRSFRLGERMIVRLPSAAEYAVQVEKEHRWLPTLQPYLPLEIPTPIAIGNPAEGYPWKRSIYRWIEGDVATPERISNLGDCAGELARFLIALHEIDPTDGPRPGLGFDDGTWDRARGWTLWKAAIIAARLTETNASDREQSLRVIDEVVSDWRRSL